MIGYWKPLCLSAAIVFAGTVPALAQSGQSQDQRSQRRVDVTPYLGVDQVVMVPLKGDGDVLTFTNVTAGVTGQVQTRRAEAVIDLQYNHRFGWGSELPDQDALTGIVNGRVNVAPGLSLNAGALASRVRTDGFSGASPLGGGSFGTQVYAGYVGPAYTTRVGDVTLNASYRLGYTRVEDDVDVGLAGTSPNGVFTDGWSHSLRASAGFAPGTILPVGLTASAGYDREDASQLDQRFTDAWGRVDATLPVSQTVALVGGIGYEDIEISQRSPLLDTNGVPVIRNGRYVTDESSPRALLYDFDDIIWDAGVLWRPNRRTSLAARVGQRYGGWTYQGSFTWEGRDSNVSIVVFDGIDSFGRVVTGDIASLSGSNFDVVRNPFSGGLTGCAFSAAGGGQCFNDALTGITGANFRYRGVAAQYALERGPWGWGLGAGYSQRKFVTPEGDTVLVRGSKDQNWYVNTALNRRLGSQATWEVAAYFNYFDASGDRLDIANYGAFTSYYRNLGRRLSASASVGVDASKADDLDSIINAMGQVGLRYSF